MYSPAARPSIVRAAPAKNRRLSTIGGISSDIVTSAGLPDVLRLELHDLVGVLLDRVGELEQRELAILRRGVEPVVLERPLGGGDGRSASSFVPSCTVAMTSPVAGLITSRVCPSDEFTHSPSMNIW